MPIWLVVSNIFYFHPENWERFPIWLIFFNWVETTNIDTQRFPGEASVGTYREFVVFDAAQIYPEYVILYEREFWNPLGISMLSFTFERFRNQGVF